MATRKGLTLTIEIKGDALGDVEIALDQVRTLVSNGYREGLDRNESGNYRFEIKGLSKDRGGVHGD